MRTVISVRELEDWERQGRSLAAIPSDALLTPSAKDFLRRKNIAPPQPSSAPSGATAVSKPAPAPAPQPSKPTPVPTVNSSAEELERYLNSPEILPLKEQICDVGRRMWQREYVDGNGGNLSIRLTDDLVLCTPTLVSKGFMKPEDLCLVDLDGNQKAGKKKRTSEILMHLQIMKSQPKAKAVCHCHPPHATAFAVAGVEPPTCMIPEIEVFIGKVPIAPYRTPGTPEMGKLVSDLVEKHNTVLMANHGVVSWSHSIEDAYFKMEIIEAYCRTVVVGTQLGVGLKTFSPGHLQDLLNIKQTLGIPDPRIGLKECELCDNNEWRPGVSCVNPAVPAASPAPAESNAPNPEAELLVQAVTEEIMKRLRMS